MKYNLDNVPQHIEKISASLIVKEIQIKIKTFFTSYIGK